MTDLKKSHYFYFILAGTAGFFVDASIVTILASYVSRHLIWDKLIGFSCAVTTTWWINRKYTFKTQKERGLWFEWLHYVIANSVGGAVNNLTYVFFIFFLPITKSYPALAVMAGSLTGLIFNYMANRWWVFRQK